jgi:N-acetylmuramic acid 6-phosphate (MurNAc-6-P) etherase
MVRHMSTTITSVLATACLGLAAFQSSVALDAESRLKDVEAQVADMRKIVDSQAKDLADAKLLAEKNARYADAQAKAAAAMLQTLDASEKAGFTFGINPESRIVLLSGWREALNAAQRDLPALPSGPAPGAKATEKSN